MPQPKLSPDKHRLIQKFLAEGLSTLEISKRAGVSTGTVSNFSRSLAPVVPELPDPKTAKLPPSLSKPRPPFIIDTPGWWLIIGDQHLPYHDRKTIELAAAEAKRRKIVGILFNGDCLDSHEISRFDKDPSAPRYVHEVEIGKEYFAWNAGQFPKARKIVRKGNHDDRFDAYVMSRAPALFGLEGVNFQSLLHLDDYGIECVGDKRIIHLGKLHVLHGHELKGGAASPVNPARGLYLKCRSVAICSHHHQTSQHRTRNIKGKAEAAWSIGCACELTPFYMPVNDWNFGFAFVHVAKDGSFEVDNKSVEEGKVV